MNFKKYFLNESMTLYVKDHVYDEEPETVLDVIHKLWSKMNLSRWWKEGGRDWIVPDTLAPDGYSALEPKGTINVYVGLSKLGDSQELSEQFVNDVRQWIEEMDIQTNVRGPEISNDNGKTVYRIDIEVPQPEEQGPPEIQLSNRNAHEIFGNVLDIHDYEYGSIDATDLILKIDAYINDIDVKAGTVEPRDEKGEGGARIIDPGMNEEEVWERLNRIKAVAEWAIENGYRTLHLS